MPHHQDPAGRCREDCPDEAHHAGIVLLALEPRLLATVKDLVSDLGVKVVYVPTAPTQYEGHRCYAAPPPTRGARRS